MKLELHTRAMSALAALFLGASLPALGQITNVINDGTTVANLTLRANQFGTGNPAATLALTAATGELQASQSPDYSDFPLNGVWFNDGIAPATNRYAVLVDARPADGYPEYVVGLMAWFDPGSGKGLACRVVPGTAGSFQVATIDFLAASAFENDSTANLFQLDGTPAQPFLGSAWAELGAYDPSAGATFRLEITPPSAADLTAVTNATARISAQVYQGEPAPVGGEIQLLTTLPVPGVHRFGYFASWGTALVPGSTIGYLDNLRLVGELRIENQSPTVAITAPTNGSRFNFPAAIPVTVEASDPEGRLARVELYDGATLVGSTNASPANFAVSGLAVGPHTFRARAMDEAGAVSESEAITIEVLLPAQPPRLENPLASPSATDFQQFKFTATGLTSGTYRIEATTNFATWTAVTNGTITGPTMEFAFPRSPGGQALFYRLVLPESGPGGLTPARLTSPAPSPSATDFQRFQFRAEAMTGGGYRLEQSSNLRDWTEVETGSVPGSVKPFDLPKVAGASAVFYRLVSLP